MATYNRADRLRKTLSNVKDFIADEDELIIIDGGSTDQTRNVVEEYKEIVSTFISEPDTGEAHAINKGLFIAKGEIIKLLTDDDYFFPTAMSSAISKLEESPQLDAIVCGGEQYEIDDTGERFKCFWRLPSDRQFSGNVSANLENLRFVGGGLALIFRKRILSRIGLLNTSVINTDVDFIIRIVKDGLKVKYFDVNLYHYVVYPHSISHNANVHSLPYIALINGAWDLFMRNDYHTVLSLLGLNKVYKGGLLAKIIINSDRLRNSHYPFLQVIFLLTIFLRTIQATYQKCISFMQAKKSSSPLGVSVFEHPNWTSELR
jgi:glycosyltransferase involved in cell wall biosynthesis